MTNSNRLHRYKQSSNLFLYYLVIDKHGIIDRFPLKDRKSCPIPSNIADFCMLPCIMEFDQSMPEAKFFTFATISTYGAPLYGACLRIFEVSSELSSAVIYNPKILMIVSEHKQFSVFEVLLGYFYLASRKKIDQSALPDIPIENYLIQLESVELPSDEGETQQQFLRFGRDTLPITIRSRFVPPALNTSFSILFDHLSVSNIIFTLQSILCEKRVIFISRNISILTPIQDLLLSFVHPLKWYHLYLPVASEGFFGRLSYFNHPFIAGTHSDIFHKLPMQNAFVINLDDSCIVHHDEIQMYRCEEFDLLCSLLNKFPKEKGQIYEFQCDVQKAIISLLQACIRPQEFKSICSREFAKQIRGSLAVRLFVADYRRNHPGDIRLSNLESFFNSYLKLPRTEKVEPMFEPKIYSKEIRNYEMMYQSHIIPISSKRLEKESKKTNLIRKPYVQLKENEGHKQNQARKQLLCNGTTVIAADFCNISRLHEQAKVRKKNAMPLKSWLSRKENIQMAEKVRSYPLNGSVLAVNSSVDSEKWNSSSDSQSIDGQEYAKDFEIDSTIQKLETRIKSQNDSGSEKDIDVFEGLSESDHEHDALTAIANDSQNQTSSSMLHCLQARNEFDAESLRMEFQNQEKNHVSLFSGLKEGKLEDLVCPMKTSQGLTLDILVERAKLSAACKCNAAAFSTTNNKKQ